MSINKITIENIRGIEKLELKDNFYPNKPIFIIAPNGYGKTSIAKAFKSLELSSQVQRGFIISLKWTFVP